MLWMIGLCLVAAALNTFRRKGEQKGVRPILSFYRWCGNGSADLSGYHGFITVSSDTFGFALETAEEETVGFYIECGQHYWQLSEAQSDSLFQSQ